MLIEMPPPDGKPEPRDTVRILTPALSEETKVLLEQHGCTILPKGEKCIVIFPAGTVRKSSQTFILSEWYRISLPDGWGIDERCFRGESTLYEEHKKKEYP